MLTVGGLFSGIGGIELGFEKAGFKILWSNENDENCNKTYKNNFNHKLYTQSINDINFKKSKTCRFARWRFSMPSIFSSWL